jgi:CHAD domain-containing protein
MEVDAAKLNNTNLSQHSSAITIFCAQISALIKMVQQKLAELLTGQDVEALHQYRVSLRKIEALLVAFHELIPEKIHKKMKADIKALFSETGQLRDLDVLLNKFQQVNPQYKHTPSEIAFIENISTKRQDEFERFRLTTQSTAYTERFLRLQAYLREVKQHDAHISLNDCWPVLLNECMSKVQTAYKKLWKQEDNRHIHKLRKALKQVRYCVELLGVLVKPHEAKTVLSWLKAQQNSLGNYNDSLVQTALLDAHGRADKAVKSAVISNNLSLDRGSLPLLKSDWKILKKKIKPLLKNPS